MLRNAIDVLAFEGTGIVHLPVSAPQVAGVGTTLAAVPNARIGTTFEAARAVVCAMGLTPDTAGFICIGPGLAALKPADVGGKFAISLASGASGTGTASIEVATGVPTLSLEVVSVSAVGPVIGAVSAATDS